MKIFSQIRKRRAFTLLEVMIAVIALAAATFAILALVSESLQNARRLQRPMIDVGPVDTYFSLTNKFVEGNFSGEMGDLFGDAYKGYFVNGVIGEEQTNKLWSVDVTIQRDDDKSTVAHEKLLYYSPQSPAGSLDGATVGAGR